MDKGALGKLYQNGEIIVRQGDTGDCMYVIQAGKVEVLREDADNEIRVAVLDEKEFFGEVPLFERKVRSATVRALGEVRVLTVDRKTLLRRITEDPSLAYRILQTMSRRIRELDAKVARLVVEQTDQQ